MSSPLTIVTMANAITSTGLIFSPFVAGVVIRRSILTVSATLCNHKTTTRDFS
jgi:hypothetical protein